jgi:hypothetical protein
MYAHVRSLLNKLEIKVVCILDVETMGVNLLLEKKKY